MVDRDKYPSISVLCRLRKSGPARCFGLCGLLLFATGWTQSDGSAPSLTVSGVGEVRIQPDRATVGLGVTRRHENAQTAQSQVNGAVEKIVQSLVNLGIGRQRIQTSELSLQPLYQSSRTASPTGTPAIVGYDASYRISVEITRLDQVGPAVDAGLQGGANRLNGIQFGVADEASFRNRALGAAVAQALEKARIMAQAAGVRLLFVEEINEGRVSLPSPQPQMARMEAVAADTPVLAGQLTFSAHVTIRFRVGNE